MNKRLHAHNAPDFQYIPFEFDWNRKCWNLKQRLVRPMRVGDRAMDRSRHFSLENFNYNNKYAFNSITLDFCLNYEFCTSQSTKMHFVSSTLSACNHLSHCSSWSLKSILMHITIHHHFEWITDANYKWMNRWAIVKQQNEEKSHSKTLSCIIAHRIKTEAVLYLMFNPKINRFNKNLNWFSMYDADECVAHCTLHKHTAYYGSTGRHINTWKFQSAIVLRKF